MRNFLQLLVSLLMIGAMAWIVWQGYTLLAGKGEALTEVQRSLVVMVGLLVLICTFLLNGAIRSVGVETRRTPLYQKRTALYEEFLRLWQTTHWEVVSRGGTHLALEAEELLTQMGLYAGTDVLHSIHQLLDTAATAGIAACQPEWENLLQLMRLDIGNKNDYGLRSVLPRLYDSLIKNHTS